MRVGVTGSNGFLGRTVVKQLKGKFDVVECTRENCDVTNLNQVKEAFKGIDVVVHCAAGRPFTKVNYLGTKNVVEACEFNKVKQLIYISSISVYGEMLGINSEQTPVNPVNPYGLSKVLAEKEVSMFKEFTILRPVWIVEEEREFDKAKDFVFNTYRLFRYGIMGLVKRQTIKVNDLAGSIVFCVGNKNCFGEIFNIAERVNWFNNKVFVGDKFNDLLRRETHAG